MANIPPIRYLECFGNLSIQGVSWGSELKLPVAALRFSKGLLGLGFRVGSGFRFRIDVATARLGWLGQRFGRITRVKESL